MYSKSQYDDPADHRIALNFKQVEAIGQSKQRLRTRISSMLCLGITFIQQLGLQEKIYIYIVGEGRKNKETTQQTKLSWQHFRHYFIAN